MGETAPHPMRQLSGLQCTRIGYFRQLLDIQTQKLANKMSLLAKL